MRSFSPADRARAGAAVAALAAFAVFVPSLSSGWLNWDDGLMVLRNPYIRGFDWVNLRWAFTSSPTGAYQPLAYLTWGLDYALWGLDARGYHLTNVLLHALNAALVFLVARRLLGGRDAELDAAALFSALVFALHPLRVESVSWIAERRDSLSGALWLGAVLAYLARRPRALVYALFSAACLAKGIAVTLPAVLFIVDVLLLGRSPRESLKDKLPMAALGGALGALAVALQMDASASWSWADHGPGARLAQAAYALAFYARKTVWPAGLSPYYEMRPPLDPLEPRFVVSALAVGGAAALLWRARGTKPGPAAAGAAYAVILLPVSGLLQAGEQLVADRYSYLAALPLAALAGGALRIGLCRPARRRAAALAAGLAVVGLAAASVRQQSHWRDSLSLWRRALDVDPNSPTALANYGAALVEAGRVREAADSFSLALAADPACLPAEGDPEKLRTRPVCRLTLNNLGAARAQLGELEEARRLLRLALRAEPGSESARRNLERVEAALRAP